MRPSSTKLTEVMPLELWLRPFAGLVLLCFVLLRPSSSLPAGHLEEAPMQVVLALDNSGGERGLPGSLHGWVSIQPASGGLAATLFYPDAGNFTLTLPGNYSRPNGIAVRLARVAPADRPVATRPAPESMEAVTPNAAAAFCQSRIGVASKKNCVGPGPGCDPGLGLLKAPQKRRP